MVNHITPLSTGILDRILGPKGEEIQVPFVVQIVSAMTIAPNPRQSKPRYRFVISDGETFEYDAILATKYNHLYESGQMDDMAIIRVNRIRMSITYAENWTRRQVIMLEIEPLHNGSEVRDNIGNPSQAEHRSAATSQIETQHSNSVSAATSRPIKKENYASQSMNLSLANLSKALTMPIDSISPYQSKWVIRARVIAKSNDRTWRNAKGEGKLFSFDLCDASGEIKVTAWNEQCDKFYEMLEFDKVYHINNFTVKAANKQYSKLKHDYEITLYNNTTIQECTDASDLPEVSYDFVKISEIADKDRGEIINVIAVVQQATDVEEFTSQAGFTVATRRIILIDQSSASISLTLWNNEARKNFDCYDHQPVVLIATKICEFNGGRKSLSGGTIFGGGQKWIQSDQDEMIIE